ncbi:MAG: hypothetical protein ACTSRZ_00450 [Promethearchaeota archaeon]
MKGKRVKTKDNNLDNREKETRDMLNWKEAFQIHLLLFGYWVTPTSILRQIIKIKSKKVFIISLLNAIGISILITFSLVGILDGPSTMVELLKFNIFVWSKMLLNYGIYTFLLIFACIIGVGFITPFLLVIIINLFLPKKRKKGIDELFLISIYGILPILFFTPLIYVIGILSLGQNPQLAQLAPQEWWNNLLYAFIGLSIVSVLLALLGQIKMIGFWWSLKLDKKISEMKNKKFKNKNNVATVN